MRVNLRENSFIGGQIYRIGIREIPVENISELHGFDAEQVEDHVPVTNNEEDPDEDVRALSELAPKTAREVADMQKQIADMKAALAEKDAAKPEPKGKGKPNILDENGDGKLDK